MNASLCSSSGEVKDFCFLWKKVWVFCSVKWNAVLHCQMNEFWLLYLYQSCLQSLFERSSCRYYTRLSKQQDPLQVSSFLHRPEGTGTGFPKIVEIFAVTVGILDSYISILISQWYWWEVTLGDLWFSLLLQAGSAVRSTQLAQVFVQSGLENL